MTINYAQPMPYYQNYQMQNPLFVEQSYIENILRLNTGKQVSVYMNFEGSQWGSIIFRGELLEAGKDHIIIRDNQTRMTYLLLSIYLSYVTFDENIEYEYPYAKEKPDLVRFFIFS